MLCLTALRIDGAIVRTNPQQTLYYGVVTREEKCDEGEPFDSVKTTLKDLSRPFKMTLDFKLNCSESVHKKEPCALLFVTLNDDFPWFGDIVESNDEPLRRWKLT